MNLNVGDRVELTDSMKRAVSDPFYRTAKGTVTYVGSWNVCDVLWDGKEKAHMMRNNELQIIEKEQ